MIFPFKRLQWLVLLLFWWLLFWAGSREYRPGMDAMTYGALAKHILSTGDWKVLHYSNQAYAEFYQHPPLGVWMATLVFKLFGVSDVTSKILPSLMALGTVAGVVVWGTWIRSASLGFLSGLVLLFSIRYVKYSSALMLDGLLAFWLVWAAIALLAALNSKRTKTLSGVLLAGSAMGGCFSAAFMTKGMPALAFVGLFGLAPFVFIRGERFWHRWFLAGLTGLLACGALFGAWFLFGDGNHYLIQYWQLSVKGRIGGAGFADHFGPVLNLLKVYWPWLPIYFVGLYQLFWSRTREVSARGALPEAKTAAVFSLLILCGFIFSGHFLEQYLTPFYPFAALVVGTTLFPWISRWVDRLVVGLFAFAVVAMVVVTLLPIHLHRDAYRSPIRIILARAGSDCRAERLIISRRVADLWTGLAMGLWYTPWDVAVLDAPEMAGRNRQEILLATEDEPLPLEWVPSRITQQNLRIYQRQGSNSCP